MSSAKEETIKHINEVRNLLNKIAVCLRGVAACHDQSKLESPEVEVFEIYTAKLKETTYGSDKYKQYLREMKPALDHHYKENRHHPEHFQNGIKGMNLIDLTEMFCDWLAATKRHADGDIFKSIKHNKDRFNYGDILESIFNNTVEVFE